MLTDDGQFRFIALYAKNREEWVISDLGAMLTGITVVTLYDTLGKESIDYILNQAKIKTVVTQADKVKGLVDLKKDGKLPLMQVIIYFDEVKKEDIEAATAADITMLKFEEILE